MTRMPMADSVAQFLDQAEVLRSSSAVNSISTVEIGGENQGG